MMEQNNSIKRVVMGRVRTVHALQMVFNTTVLSVGIFMLSLYGIAREVWVARVFQDEPSFMNVSALIHFYLSAFMGTRFIVQALSIIALGALIWLTYNLLRMTRMNNQSSISFA